jgi:hypothetical protein
MLTSALKGLAACIALCMASPCCSAQGRPNTTAMSCAAAKNLVTRQHAIVLSTGPTTYDRYVASAGFCQSDEVGRAAFVPSADNPQCFIGFYCVRPSLNSR